ncbi:hypothetical protein SFRURICE_019938 [Spodoptera frugiperda]|nr:hypothetical protein SFRURICE_019938 [Spodoptera frugiperda]
MPMNRTPRPTPSYLRPVCWGECTTSTVLASPPRSLLSQRDGWKDAPSEAQAMCQHRACRLWNPSRVLPLPEARLKLSPVNRKNPIITKQRIVKINTELDDYPPASFYFLRNNVSLPQNNKFDFYRHPQTADVILSIKNTNVSDSANYTLVVSNGYLKKNHTYELLIKAKPTIDFGPKVDKKYEQNTQASLQCVVTGYPLPEVTWIFSNGEDQTMPSTQIYMHSKYQETAILDIPVHASGDISCKASNSEDTAVETRRLLVYEIHNGFGIRNREKSWFSENEDVTITCIASIYDFYSVTWLGPDGEDLRGTNAVEYTNSSFSLLAKLKFSQISLNHSGLYTCQGSKLNSSNTESEDINITVAPLQSPIIKIPEDDQAIEVVTYQEVELTCQAEGVPPPKLEWHKDGVLMDNETNAKIYIHEINRTIVNSSIRIDRLLEENQGTYECLAISAGLTATRLYTVALKASSYELYLSIILVVIFVLIIVVLYLMWRVRKDTQFRKELKASGLLYFNEGATKSLNPDLGIDEQADLLPYDEKFEFPADKLILGAFGVVYKADARGIINAEETTEVAVKMVKKTADNIAHSDYFASCTQDTDHTFVNTANTNRSTRKVSEGYVQPEWRTNYESDYSFDGRNPRPLTSRDLLVWAFQIARGMEYLASRKVLHGDLAARNVLLAEDNIVKICDFGLARSIYKNDEYQKKENCLLPVKWLAIECMTDRIFSTQSDVWSFGIVLWELFSLAKTPYPNISPAHLLQWLSEGKRLEKPPYADDRLYNVMMRCWEQKPTSRPSFSQLQEILGGFLEDNVRNHYVDLNTAYMDTNVKPGGEDYLAMVCAPDYNNLVTPSPHHYVNDRSFFPTTPTQIDEEGYLQMSPASRQNIFSPRAQDMKFDFDSRKFNPRVSEASSCGSELTPMLTLNNLPARSGSESDHEGNASPYLNMCPRIDEEADDVFETNQNNAKNALNTAHTNPTYISLDVDIEKKPKDIINSYINVPNGLVK